jgi:hypothetical protein
MLSQVRVGRDHFLRLFVEASVTYAVARFGARCVREQHGHSADVLSPPITGTGKRAIAADGFNGMAKCFSDFFVCTDVMFADLFLEQMALFRWIVPSIRRIPSCDHVESINILRVVL